MNGTVFSTEVGIRFARSSATFVFSLWCSSSLPHAPHHPPRVLRLPFPLSHLSLVWLLILAKEKRSNISPPVYEVSAGASRIRWLGLTDGRGPQVLKSVTDSSGFDSPRSFHIGSPKTPGKKKKRKKKSGAGGRWVGNKSICRVFRAGGSTAFLKFIHSPCFHFFSIVPFHLSFNVLYIHPQVILQLCMLKLCC